MKHIFLFILLTASSHLFAKEFYTTCNNCSSYQMKQTAEAIVIPPYGPSYVSVFDESDKEYRRYRLSTTNIEDFIPVTIAIEIANNADIEQSFSQYVDAMRKADDVVSNITSLEVSDSIQIQSLSMKSTISSSAKSMGDGQCEAKEVNSGDLTAHDYVSSSRNRRLLFHTVKLILDAQGNGEVSEAVSMFEGFMVKLENTGSTAVNMTSAVLGVLDLRSHKLNMPDGGFITGSLNFNTQSFDIAVATDGNCYDIPTDADKVESEYIMATAGSTESMIDTLIGLGGSLHSAQIPVCQREIKVCTGVNGVVTSCTSVCFSWR